METFIRIHADLHRGKRVVKNPTAYIAQWLGFDKSAPKVVPTGEPRVDTDRHNEPKPLGGVVTNVIDKMKP